MTISQEDLCARVEHADKIELTADRLSRRSDDADDAWERTSANQVVDDDDDYVYTYYVHVDDLKSNTIPRRNGPT